MLKKKIFFLAVLLLFLGFGCCAPSILNAAPLPVSEKSFPAGRRIPEEWRGTYEALTQTEKAEADLWFSWFAGKNDREKQKILYRPYAFGTYYETTADSLKEALGPEVAAMVEENNSDPEGWWSWYASLPEKDSRMSQEFMSDWLLSFAELPEEQRLYSNLRADQWQPGKEKLAPEELEEKMKTVAPAVLKTAEKHVGDPALWWSHYFLEPDRELAERDMEWLVWFSGLSPEDQAMVDQKTHLFFSSQVSTD